MALIKRKGYGQVEPNHLSAPRNGQVYAQLPADKDVFTDGLLEQGMFVKYDYAADAVNLDGAGEFMMVYNEEKLYDERHQSHKDYAMKAAGLMGEEMVPRLLKTTVGDIFTTNNFGKYDPSIDGHAGVELVQGDKVDVDPATGYLRKSTVLGTEPAEGNILFQVAKVYTMPDGQPGVKLQRIA